VRDEDVGSRAEPPADFVAFVVRHADDVAPVAVARDSVAGLTTRQRQDVLTEVARRWWWLRWQARRLGRAEAADDLLDRLLSRQEVEWDGATASVTVGPTRAVSVLDRPLSPAEVADGVWNEARRTRRRRAAAALGITLVVLMAVTVSRHRAPESDAVVPPRPVPVPTVRPPSTDVVPVPAELATLPPLTVAGLPGPRIELDPAGVVGSLATHPVKRATALFEPDDRPGIYLVGDDGQLRLLDAQLPVGTRLTSTSLSPDGTQAALLSQTQVTVVNLLTRAARTYPAMSAQSVVATSWLGPTSLAVSDSSHTFALDLTSGAVGSTGYLAGDLVQEQPPGPLVELISVDDPPTSPARIRHWAGGTPADTRVVGLSGAPVDWLGRWQGPGWACDGVLVRDAATVDLALPATDAVNGVASAASVVIDETTGAVRRVLAYPGNPAALALLGFLEPQTVLLRAGDSQKFGILAWTWGTGQLRLVTELSAAAVISVSLR
jgi:hypothetical protein